MRLACLASIVAIVLAAPAEGQRKYTTRIESVRVDVLVTDGRRPVPGLTAADFEVRDNGVLQNVSLVDASTAPINLMIALDASASLSTDRLDRLRNASRAIISRLRDDESAGLLTFSHVIRQAQPMTLDRARLEKALSSVEAGGDTALIDATATGLALTEEGAGRGLLVVFSDGVDTHSWQSAEAVVRSARRFETVLYAVSVAAQGESPQFLRDMASATGGKVFEVESNERLERAFVEILDEFRQRYLLSYSPIGVPQPGWHRIDVRVKKRGATVRARPGYFTSR